MGRTIKIILDDKQKAALKKAFRTSENYIFRLRCQMVLLKSEGRTSKEVGEILDFCEQAVNGWLRRYLNHGLEGLQTKAGQGRIPILDVREDAPKVRLAVAEHRQRVGLARADLEESLGRKFSEKTLRRFLKNCVLDIKESGDAPPSRKSKRFISRN